ncbi:MAG: hypothetical protein IK016_08210 [Lachnospiraceae bacterium]|nr:hypothetical protein [Lachnospiraceae bacterium]
MGRVRNQMISVRDLLRKMRSHAVISVLSAVGLATIGCGFVVFSAIGGLDTATYATKVIEEGDQINVYADEEGTEQVKNMLRMVQDTVEEVRLQAAANFNAVERAEDAVVLADERAQQGFESTSEQIAGINAHMNNSLEAVQEVGRKVEEGNRAGENFFQNVLNNMSTVNESLAAYQREFGTVNDGIAGVNDSISGVNRDVTSLQENLNAFGASVSGQFTDSNDKLNRLLEQLELSNQNIMVLQTQLDEARQEIETLKGMVTNVSDAQNALGITIAETEEKRIQDYDELKTMIDTNATNITNVSNRVPFALGVDGEGEYGYVKDGADAVIPFRHPGPQTGDAVGVVHKHAEGSACYQTSLVTEMVSCGGSTHPYAYSNCSKCNEGPDYCAANPACAAGGAHSIGATLYECNRCGSVSASEGYCGNQIKTEVQRSTLVCNHSSCGRMQIENGYYRTGRRECPLTVVCTGEGAGMSVVSYSWRAAEKGVISGKTNAATATAAHNGLYICTVTLRDNTSGLTYQEEVSYRVINLIK